MKLISGILIAVCFFYGNIQAQSVDTGNVTRDRKTISLGPAGQDAVSCDLRMERPFQIDVSRDGKERQFPFVYKFGKNIFVSYSEHPDKVLASPTDALMISRNNGKTWKKKIENKDFYITSMVKKSGILYAIVYFTYPVSKKEEKMIYWTSKDMGDNWEKHEGQVIGPDSLAFGTHRGIWGSMLFHRGMTVTKDGAIEGVMYGHIGKEKKYTTVLVRSTDNCATWNIVSVIAAGVPSDAFQKAEGYCEPTLIKVRDGSLLCVMRIGSYLPLFQSRSLDEGKTWSTPVALPGLSQVAAQSVCPELLLLKNGVLALTYGRPYDRLAFSKDGSGYEWDCSSISYPDETTGYSGIVESSPGEILQVSDQGRTGAKQMAIWGRFIKVMLRPARAVQ